MSAFLTLASFWLPHHPTSCYYSKGFDSAIFSPYTSTTIGSGLDVKFKAMWQSLLFLIIFSQTAMAKNQTTSAEKLAAKRLAFWEKVISGKFRANKTLRNETPPKELGISTETSTLNDAIKNLGKNKIIRTGDASTSEATLCYEGKDGTIIGISSDEMHGTTHVANISIFSSSSEHNFPNCALSDKINKALQTKSGLSLDLSRLEAEKIFGPPSKKEKEYSLYRYELQHKRKGYEEGAEYECTDGQEILIHFKNDTVDWYALRNYGYC